MKRDLLVVVTKPYGKTTLLSRSILRPDLEPIFQYLGTPSYEPLRFRSVSEAARAVGNYLTYCPDFVDHRDIRVVREVEGEERRILDINGRDGFVLKVDDAEPDDDCVFLLYRDIDSTFYCHLSTATVFASKRAAVEALESYMRESGAKGLGAYFPVLRRIRIERTKTYEDVRLGG